MRKFTVERQCLITGNYDTREINWKHLINLLSLKSTEHNKTVMENGKYYRSCTHMFSAMDKNYYYKILYNDVRLT